MDSLKEDLHGGLFLCHICSLPSLLGPPDKGEIIELTFFPEFFSGKSSLFGQRRKRIKGETFIKKKWGTKTKVELA